MATVSTNGKVTKKRVRKVVSSAPQKGRVRKVKTRAVRRKTATRVARPKGFIGPLLAEHKDYKTPASVRLAQWHSRSRTLEEVRTTRSKRWSDGIARWVRRRCPWMLPEWMPKTLDLTLDETVDEAQEYEPMLREVGWRNSALFNPSQTNAQYLRIMQFLGKTPVKPYVVQVMTTVGMALAGALLFFLGFEQDSADLALDRKWFIPFGGFGGLLFGYAIGYSTRCFSQFSKTHAFARVAQKKTINGVRYTMAVYELPLLRMAFANRHTDRLFSGTEDNSGFANGRMNLETNLELAAITDPRELYKPGAVFACTSSYTGVNTTTRHSLTAQAKHAGRIRAQRQAMLSNGAMNNWLGEHKGLVFFVVCTLIAGAAMIIGIEVDPSKPLSFLE